VDIVDEGRDYRVILDVPGATSDGLEVKPGPAMGTLQVRIPCGPEPTTTGQVLRRERVPRPEGAYVRVVPVAWDANVEKAKPTVSNGVLTIVVPKTQSAGHGEKRS
jgi:HSP20 family molecular chaperone IbpA